MSDAVQFDHSHQLDRAIAMAAKQDQIVWVVFSVFAAANALLLAALFTTGKLPNQLVGIIVSCIGALLSWVWCRIQRRAIDWLEYYEEIIARLEEHYLQVPTDVALSAWINKATYQQKVGRGLPARALMAAVAVIVVLIWVAALVLLIFHPVSVILSRAVIAADINHGDTAMRQSLVILFGDGSTLVLAHIALLGLLVTALVGSIRRYLRGRNSAVQLTVIRGPTGMNALYVVYGLATVAVTQAIQVSTAATGYKAFFVLFDYAVLLYLFFFNGWFRNCFFGIYGRVLRDSFCYEERAAPLVFRRGLSVASHTASTSARGAPVTVRSTAAEAVSYRRELSPGIVIGWLADDPDPEEPEREPIMLRYSKAASVQCSGVIARASLPFFSGPHLHLLPA